MAAEARYLYEHEPVTLSEIADKLNVNYSTVRNWKSRDKQRNNAWQEKKKTRKRRMNKNSLDNLIYFKPMNQQAFKHGAYTQNLTSEAMDIYNTIKPQHVTSIASDLLYLAFSRYLAAQKYLDHSNPAHIKADTIMCRTLLRIIKDTMKESKENENTGATSQK